MSDRVIYVSRNCPHCRKLLIGIHKYDFLKSQFQIIDVLTQSYPDYIESVPNLVANQQMIKNDDVFDIVLIVLEPKIVYFVFFEQSYILTLGGEKKQKSAKQQQMDQSYERLMAERNLITR